VWQAYVFGFLDVRKAYDTVSREGLALRLVDLATPARVLSMVRAYYSDDSACVLLDGKRSGCFPLSLGVKQGDISSPILFSCYVNPVVELFDARPDLGVDLEDGMKRLSIQLFADDMVLMAESPAMLREMLKIMSDFIDGVRLKLSIGLKQSKSAVMVYGQSLVNHPVGVFSVCGDQIPIVSVYRYLGVMLHNEGSWEPQLAQLRSVAGKSLFQMRLAGLGKYGLPPRRGRDIIRTQINPAIEFASGVWLMDNVQTKSVVSIWNKAVRYAAGVPSFCSIDSVVGDMDLLEASVPSRWMQYRLVMWHKILRMDSQRLVRRCYELWRRPELVNNYNFNPNRNWHQRICQDLGSLHLNLVDCRDELVERSSESWKLQVRELILSQVTCPGWRKSMSVRPHLELYSSSVRDPVYEDYKPEGSDVVIRKKQSMFERYLDSGPDRHLRQFHMILRAGSLPLQTFRRSFYRCGGVEDSTVCFMCGLEDESISHFMNRCSAYDDLKARSPCVGPISRRRIVFFPSLASDEVALLFAMWRRRISTWRHTHPFQDPVQRLF